tara:strand:- start:17549 stop:18628 length:1080 start_codon:yes stop_codon:yes gene_type:complete
MIEEVKCEHCNKFIKNTPRSIGSHVGYWHKDIAKKLYHKKTTFTIKCLECNELIGNSNNVIGRHLRKVHKIEYPDYIVKHEFNNEWPICQCGCDEKLEWKKGGFSRFKKNHGSRGENNPMFGLKGKDNPNTGKIRTDEQKKKYSEAAKESWADETKDRRKIFTPEYAENMRKISKEISSRPGINEARSKSFKIWIDKHPEYREFARQHAYKLIEEGIIGPSGPYKAEWKYNPFTQQDEYMHSSWESKYLDTLIANNHIVKATKNHNIKIKYIDVNNIEREYTPDFLVETPKITITCILEETTTTEKTLVEIKPKSMIDNKVILKTQAATKWCKENGFNYVVLTYNKTQDKFEIINEQCT